MINIDNLDQLSNYSINELCNELYRIDSLDSKNLQNLYLIAVLSNNITERLKHETKH